MSLLIPTDILAVERFDRGAVWKGRFLGNPAPLLNRHFPAFLNVGSTHPLFPLFRLGKLQRHPTRISDVISRPRLRDLPIYSEFLLPLGVDRQMAISWQLMDGTKEILILSRNKTDFSANEQARLAAFMPHILCARRDAEIANENEAASARTIARKNLARPSAIGKNLDLTVREAEILGWLANGKRDQDIAEICKISRRTVQKHCENIFRKLGVESRTEAVIRALETL
jgi:DNA-binding CsgD family transcriptional regulator